MKNLELNQMENLQGGGSCASDAIGFGIATVGLAFLLLSNPVGWIAVGAAYATVAGYGGATVNLVANGNCF